MKTIFLLPITILLFISTATSQDHKFQVGLDGGPSSTFVYGFEYPFAKDLLTSMVGYSVSSTFQFNFSKKLSILSGIGFERKGAQSNDKISLSDEFGNEISSHILRINYNYINIPIMMKYTLGTNKLRYYGNVGGYLSFLTQARNELVGYEPQSKEDGVFTEDIQNIDFGVSAGLGIQYALSSKISLSLEIRNNLGLYNISKLPIYNDGTNKLNSTNLLIGGSYGFGE